jgi:hypothetical protein
MSVSRRLDYLDHMQRAATDACGFVERLSKADFLREKVAEALHLT